ncbi:pimeloyl-ACP methyl ester carboxylesterase [Natronospira proteinivora]|uniref:Pimeloyl-ACP methyl ester carboxylesterase n=1 Tax=Natronospira proteinivora TaxID=1807133 RepID=A0ABT1G4L6_9GAMM|nr:alpha/beta hydrolase [Natronospira proteinivora]MCP1726229.1 pimeloyl-ACP methyl ester carboxylesterase [Natronospira proteinivora]
MPAGIQARCAWFEPGVQGEREQAIRLPLLLMRRDSVPETAPLTIHLPGGPGAAAGTDEYSAWYWGAWLLELGLEDRLLIFDPRGTGMAEPRLHCPGNHLAISAMLAQPLSATAESRLALKSLSQCRGYWQDRGVALDDFAARHLLDDVPAIMDAIGEEKARLLGLSHGSRLALRLLEDHPDRFSAAVLDGVFPPHIDPFQTQPEVHAYSLRNLTGYCRSQEGCSDRQLRDAHEQVRNRLAEQAVLIQVPRHDAPDQALWLTEARFLDLVFAAQAFDESLATLPSSIVRAADKDYRSFARMLSQVIDPALDPDRNVPVYWASLCNEGHLPNPEGIHSAAHRRGLEVSFPVAGLRAHPCLNDWAGPFTRENFAQPVTAEQPVLLLAGQWDSVTPVSWTREQAALLDNAHVLEVKGRSHGVVFDVRCAGKAVKDFLESPNDFRLSQDC